MTILKRISRKEHPVEFGSRYGPFCEDVREKDKGNVRGGWVGIWSSVHKVQVAQAHERDRLSTAQEDWHRLKGKQNKRKKIPGTLGGKRVEAAHQLIEAKIRFAKSR
jgi:hypothetical protein